MQLDIKVKIICAASDDYCYFSYNDKALKIGPPLKEIYDGNIRAMDYYHMRSSCLSKVEKHCAITGYKEVYESGLNLVDELLGLQEDPSVYMDWRGIRRGLSYQIMLYVFIIGDSQYYRYVDSIRQVFEKYRVEINNQCYEIDHSNTHLKENGCFEIDSHFNNAYIDYERPHCKYYRFFRDNEDELYTLEKHTQGLNWVSWDKELPSEGDGGFDTITLLTFLKCIWEILVFGAPILWALIENGVRKKFEDAIIEKYGIDGRLEFISKTGMNRFRRPIYTFQDKRGDRILAEFEVDAQSGEIRRYLLQESRRMKSDY